jgi:hypothetical protein
MPFTANPAPGESKTTWPTKLTTILSELKGLADRNNAQYTAALNADNIVDGSTNKAFTATHKIAVEGFAGAYSVSGSLVGGVALDSYTGTDDQRLTSAMSYASSQPFPVPIIVSNRQHTFSTTDRVVYSGFKLIGGYGFGNQKRGTITVPNDLKFNGTGVWFTMTGAKVYDLQFGNLSLTGNSGAQFMETGSTVLWTSVFHDLGFNLWKHIFGNPSVKFLITAVTFYGWWNANNGYNTAFTIGGSDSNLFMDGCLLDSPPGTMTAGQYHFIADYLEKTQIGPMFITCEQNSGLWIKGNSGTVQLILCGAGRAEGRNAGLPCYGSNIRIDGHGGVTIRDWWISYGFSNAASSGHTGEGGTITITGVDARVLIEGMQHGRATGVAESVPVVYQTGGYVRCLNSKVEEANGWANTPGRTGFKSTGGSYTIDGTYTDLSTDTPARKIAA